MQATSEVVRVDGDGLMSGTEDYTGRLPLPMYRLSLPCPFPSPLCLFLLPLFFPLPVNMTPPIVPSSRVPVTVVEGRVSRGPEETLTPGSVQTGVERGHRGLPFTPSTSPLSSVVPTDRSPLNPSPRRLYPLWGRTRFGRSNPVLSVLHGTGKE